MYINQGFQTFLDNIVHFPNPASRLNPVDVQRMMRTHRQQQQSVYVMLDEAGVIRKLGASITALSGFSPSELEGLRLSDVFQSQKLDGVLQKSEFMNKHLVACYHKNGDFIQFTLQLRQLDGLGKTGGSEGLMWSNDTSLSRATVVNQNIPLLSLSLSGGVLSCNAGGHDLLQQWHCELGNSVPDQIQDQLLDTWCAARPMRFGANAYLPLEQEGVLLLSANPPSVQHVHAATPQLQVSRNIQLQPAG